MIRVCLAVLGAAVTLHAGTAFAQLRPLSEQELSTHHGQGFLVLNNSS